MPEPEPNRAPDGDTALISAGPLRRWAWPAMVIALVSVVILLLLAVVTHELQAFRAEILRSDQVRTEIAAISAALNAAERDGRAFVQNNDPARAEAFDQEQQDTASHLAALAATTGGNPARDAGIGRLRPFIEDRLKALSGAVEQRRTGNAAGAAQAVAAIPALILITTLGIEDPAPGRERADAVDRAIVMEVGGFAVLLIVIAVAVFSLSEFARRGAALATANQSLRDQALASHASEQRFSMFVKGVTDYALYMLDLEGHVSSWNAGAERIKGYAADEILGQHFSRFYTAEDAARGAPQKALETALREGKFEAEAWRVRKDGSRFLANVVIDPLYDDAGRHTGFAKITRDITERHRQQEALEQTRATLAQAQKMEALGQLTGGIAHDFNNMLAVILGALNIMQRRMNRGDANIAPMVQAAIDATQRGAALTQRLLAFSRQKTLAPTAFQIDRLIAGMSDMIRRTLGEAVETAITLGNAGHVFADADELETAVLNLVINARDAMAGQGKLAIETGNAEIDEETARQHKGLSAGPYVTVAVTDTGAGMPPEVLAKAFDPFFTTKDSGTGLGLSQVYGFVTQSGGRVEIASQLGRGTIVRIYLPRRAAPEAVEDAAPSQPLPQAQDGESVLVVEDQDAVREVSVGSLQELGYRVWQADNADSALAILADHPEISLLFTDIVMPKLNGVELAKIARARRPGLRVLFTSGYPRDALPTTEPAIRILPKPFLLETLARAVRETLDSAA